MTHALECHAAKMLRGRNTGKAAAAGGTDNVGLKHCGSVHPLARLKNRSKTQTSSFGLEGGGLIRLMTNHETD